MGRNSLAVAALAYAAVLAATLVGVAFLNKTPGFFQGMTLGDSLDLFTPFLTVAVAWMLYREVSPEAPASRAILLFLLVLAAWLLGHGMHLSANSITRLTTGGPQAVANLTHFYDEVLSHFIWHGAIAGFSALVLWRSRDEVLWPTAWRLLTLAGFVYGWTFFLIVVEAGTLYLGLPAAVLVLFWLGLEVRRRKRLTPLGSMFALGYLVFLVLLAAWAVWQKGVPQFSQVGFL
jgi:hypothetical protein